MSHHCGEGHCGEGHVWPERATNNKESGLPKLKSDGAEDCGRAGSKLNLGDEAVLHRASCFVRVISGSSAKPDEPPCESVQIQNCLLPGPGEEHVDVGC